LYRIVNKREIDRHELTLRTTSDGIALYAFTFTSCLVPGEMDAGNGQQKQRSYLSAEQ
jgi:hypothetical protein